MMQTLSWRSEFKPFFAEKEPSAEPHEASRGLLFQKMEVLRIMEFCSE